MATVNKNFVVKNGLVVQGSIATINGNNILAENTADSYILNLVGGATLVKSVDSVFTVDNNGKLTFNYGSGLVKSGNNLVIDRATVDGWYDALGAAQTAENNAKSYTDSQISTFSNNTASDIQDALATAEAYTDSAISTEVSNRNSAIATAKSEAQQYADNAASNAQSAAESFATSAANNALASANTYTDGKVSDLVNSAPAMLDTLGELATALQNNPDIISDLQSIAAGKQGTLTAGEGIYIDGDNVITGRQQSGGGLKFVFNEAAIDRSTVDAWYDPAGAATNAYNNATSYADDVASQAQYAAQSYADTAATNAENSAKSYADTVGTNTLNSANSYTDNAISQGLQGYVTETGNETLTNKTLVDPRISGNIELLDGSGNYEALISLSSNELVLDTDSRNIILSPEGGDVYVQNSSTSDNIVATHKWVADNFDEIGAANNALNVAETYTDNAIQNGNSGATPTYAGINLDWVSKLIAGYTSGSGTLVPVQWSSNYGTAKFTVHVRDGVHSQASEILIARDSSNNIHMTEYAIVTTNGILADVSATYDSGNMKITVTPTNGHTSVECAASGSAIIWAD